MSEKYAPKVGDKVRATLGESVVIGRVSGVRVCEGKAVLATVVPSERSFEELSLNIGGAYWDFEQVVSVPSKFGAVIRRADGVKFTLTGDEHWYSFVTGFVGPDAVTAGGFTILFNGVDE